MQLIYSSHNSHFPSASTEHMFTLSRCRCSSFGYVSNIGQIAIIDDDVVRARSSAFENETGISLVNIPDKGMGAPQHVCVAMPSGFLLGGHFSLKGQGCLEAVKVILMDIAGPSVTLESHMLNKITNTIALDRGYQTEELINQLNEWGCTIIGTLKPRRLVALRRAILMKLAVTRKPRWTDDSDEFTTKNYF